MTDYTDYEEHFQDNEMDYYWDSYFSNLKRNINLGDFQGYSGSESVEDYIRWLLLYHSQILMIYSKGKFGHEHEWWNYNFLKLNSSESFELADKEVTDALTGISETITNNGANEKYWYSETKTDLYNNKKEYLCLRYDLIRKFIQDIEDKFTYKDSDEAEK